MKTHTQLLVIGLAITCVLTTHVMADPPPDLTARQVKPQQDYSEVALDAYGFGYALIERAHRFEHDEKAARDEHAREEAALGAAESYADALKSFKEAVSADPRMYEAHTYIGYVQRKLGRYNESMAAYAAALQLKPNYARAIEYQGEAYLGLHRFDDARFNYLRLYALDASQAAKLLDAMRAWVADRQREPGAVSADQLQAANEWLREQRVDAVTQDAW